VVLLTRCLLGEMELKAASQKFIKRKAHYQQLSELFFNYSQFNNKLDELVFDNANLYFKVEHRKCLLVNINIQEPQISQLRMKFRTLACQINEEAHIYEPIKEIFKRYYNVFKKSSDYKQTGQQTQMQKTFEFHYMLYSTKDIYIKTYCQSIARQLALYSDIRKKYLTSLREMKPNEEHKNTLEQFKMNQQVSKD